MENRDSRDRDRQNRDGQDRARRDLAGRNPDDQDPSAPGANEISLDPEDWQEFGHQAHRALDLALEHMRTLGVDPPWRPFPPEAQADLERPLPRRPEDFARVLDRFERSILPFPTGNGHPRFWGWVMGNGTPEAAVADLLASAMNPHLAGYDQSASAVERQVIRWLLEVMGYPADGSGLLVSGGTLANLTGLAVARRAKAGFDVREEGLASQPPLRLYGSVETHSWAEKCSEVLGLGRRAVRRVAADRQGRVDVAALKAAIAADRRRGERPFCVIGNAGTVDTGAIDDLEALADLCAEEGLWLHVDGAFGALIALSPSLRPRLRGLARTDSLAFDLHKWGYLPYEVGCALVRNQRAHRAAFETRADYLRPPGRGLQPEPLEFADLGVQLSRGFRALKVWMALSTHGTERLGRVIEQNVEQAAYLARRIEREPRLELLVPVPLNVVCFRYRGRKRDDEHLDRLNREILMRLQEDGVAIPSSTVRSDHFAIRLAITNHRSRRSDFDAMLDAVLELGDELDGSDELPETPR